MGGQANGPLAGSRPIPQKTTMELGDILARPERWARVLGWATLAGLELGVIGPFDSFRANIFTRIIYWTVLFWVGGVVMWPSVVAALALGARRGFPPLFSGIACVLVVSAPLAAIGAAGCYLFWPVHASGIRTLEYYGLAVVVALPAVAGLVWLELGRTPGFRAQLALAPAGPAMPEDEPAASSPAPLPDHLLARALCLQMEDHHIRVHMRDCSHLHFGVMRDAVRQAGEERGLQVHRSWWVAADAVAGWERADRAAVLLLTNGLRLPVARNRLAMLRAKGWLEEHRRAA